MDGSSAVRSVTRGRVDTDRFALAGRRIDRLAILGLRGRRLDRRVRKDRTDCAAHRYADHAPRSVDADPLVAAVDCHSARAAFSHHPQRQPQRHQTRAAGHRPAGDALVVEGIHTIHDGLARRLDQKVFIDANYATPRHFRLTQTATGAHAPPTAVLIVDDAPRVQPAAAPVDRARRAFSRHTSM